MNIRQALCASVAAGILALATTPAHAGTPELLKRLHAKGILTDEEFQELLAEEAAPTAAPAPAAAVVPGDAMARAQQTIDTTRMVRMTQSGIGLEFGPATITLSRSVNEFYVLDTPNAPSATTAVVGGIANVSTNNSSAVRNSLLPGFLKVSVEGSYGESRLDNASAADRVANPNLLDINSSYVGQLRYGLTSWVTLIGEYVHSQAKAHSGNKAQSDTVAVGGILFF